MADNKNVDDSQLVSASTGTPGPGDIAKANAPSLKQAAVTASGRSALMGAIFLMATSAIGPGFLTQTAVFTNQLGAAFAFAILVSILIDIAVQLNVWRIIGISECVPKNSATRLSQVLVGCWQYWSVLAA